MVNKNWFFIYPRMTDGLSYAFIPIPTICINGYDYGVFRRKVKIQLGWLFFGVEFSFEYDNKAKIKRMAKEWETEAKIEELAKAKLEELRGKAGGVER